MVKSLTRQALHQNLLSFDILSLWRFALLPRPKTTFHYADQIGT
jgi:hypothetical protein